MFFNVTKAEAEQTFKDEFTSNEKKITLTMDEAA